MKKAFIYIALASGLVISGGCSKNEHKSDPQHKEHEEDHDHSDENHSHSESDKEEDHPDGIILFTEEQSKHILDFKVEKIKKCQFYEILKTSGQILAAPGDERQVSATMSGIVSLSNPDLVEGYTISAGQQLFSISAKNLSENNTSARLNEAKAILNNSKAEYDRANALIADKIISQKDFDQIKLAHDQALVNYQTLSAGMSSGGKSITSPMTGYIKNLSVQSGEYVEMGQTMATITQNRRLFLRADVSQKYTSLVKNVKTATFTTPYDNQTYDLNDMNGRLVSIGKSSVGNSFYTPINFEFDNVGNVIEGSFVEVYLKSQIINNTLILPVSALIEEQGHFFVFVQQEHDDEYIKKEVKIGGTDGINREIISGINEGDKVVTKGAYALKLASISGAMPEHSHEH